MLHNSYSTADVRNDPIGVLNRLLNWVFSGHKPKFLRRLATIIFHIEVPQLLHPIRLPHPYSIVVNSNVILGRNVTLYHGVTIGSKRYGSRSGCPIIEDNVVIFPNAVIVGCINIGMGSIIQAGSIVVTSVPAFSIVGGNPAKIIGQQVAAIQK